MLLFDLYLNYFAARYQRGLISSCVTFELLLIIRWCRAQKGLLIPTTALPEQQLGSRQCRITQHQAVDLELPGEGFLAEGVEEIVTFEASCTALVANPNHFFGHFRKLLLLFDRWQRQFKRFDHTQI